MGMGNPVPFSRVAKHMVTVPVTVNGSHPSHFILDTGIGVNLLFQGHAGRFDTALTGEAHTGRRMSGQPVTTPMARLPSLRLGELERKEVQVALFDLGQLPPDRDDIAGILSLGFFDGTTFSIDYLRGEVRIGEDPAFVGSVAPIRLIHEGPSLAAYLRMVLPSGHSVEVEVDSGTDCLILHSKFMAELGVDPNAASTVKREGVDETGFRYTRFFAPITGEVHVDGARSISQRDPAVMFQDIIYDGLVGDEFLRQFAVAFDLDRSVATFRKPPT